MTLRGLVYTVTGAFSPFIRKIVKWVVPCFVQCFFLNKRRRSMISLINKINCVRFDTRTHTEWIPVTMIPTTKWVITKCVIGYKNPDISQFIVSLYRHRVQPTRPHLHPCGGQPRGRPLQQGKDRVGEPTHGQRAPLQIRPRE